ncbi:MAG: hypothetical protein QM302_00255 [Acidobacteriota bacterium]|nr:hypothetical protein [Acidobacteriota bacterium]
MANHFLNDPIYEEPNNASVQLTLENSATSRMLRQFDTLEETIGQDVMEGLNPYQISTVQLAMGKGRVTTKELGERIGKGGSLCARTLKELSGMGILEWHGSSTHDPSQYYTLAR